MQRPLMTSDFLLIGGVAGVILSCLLFLFWSYPRGRHSTRRKVLPARKDFGEMHGADGSAHAGEGSLDLHETAGVNRDYSARARTQD
jgi:hypothetical protein